MSRTILFLILSIGIINSCGTSSQLSKAELSGINTPPNTILVNDTLFIDKTEMTNIDWREYLYYFKSRYGEESEGYQSSSLDSLSSLNIEFSDSTSYQIGYRYYLDNYDNYPAIGITLDQAKQYSKWRSDAVFYRLLIEIDYVKPKDHLGISKTIQTYFDSFDTLPEKMRLDYYPQYYIPTRADWEIVKNLINDKTISISPIQSNKILQFNINEYGLPFQPRPEVYSEEIISNDNVLFDVLGGIAELVDTDNLIFGGSCKDDYSEIRKMKFKTIDPESDLVGFRNFCRLIKTSDMVGNYKPIKYESIGLNEGEEN